MADAKRVLVADDDSSWLNILQGSFKRLGCVVDSASNYVETREFLDKNVYALIVSDNGMPLEAGLQPHPSCGLQLLAYAKKHGRNRDTLFVLHTADDREETEKLAVKLGGIYRSKISKEYIDDFFKRILSI